MVKKKKKLPPGGISLGSSSTTTWKQTPTSRAVDEREDKKLMKDYLLLRLVFQVEIDMNQRASHMPIVEELNTN